MPSTKKPKPKALDERFKIKSVFCPYSNGPCDKRCPAWVERVLTIENINTSRTAGWCKKLDDFDEDDKLKV